MQHAYPNLVVTTLANNSLKYRNPPPVFWLTLAFLRQQSHKCVPWDATRYQSGGGDEEHPSLVVTARLLIITRIVYRVWIMPCDWIYREVMRITCFILAMQLMQVVQVMLRLNFAHALPQLDELLRGDPDDIAQLQADEDADFCAEFSLHPNPEDDHFYTVRRGAASRARVSRNDLELLRGASAQLESEFAANLITFRKTRDGVFAVGTLADEAATDIIRFFKKDGLRSIAPFDELYRHMFYTFHRRLLEIRAERPWSVLTEFVMTSYHCFAMPFSLPFESKVPNLPSPSRLDHSGEGSNDPHAHLTGFARGAPRTMAHFEAVAPSTFVWDAHVLNQGFMKASAAQIPTMIGNWTQVAERVTRRNQLLNPRLDSNNLSMLNSMCDKLSSIHSQMIQQGANKIQRIR